MRANVSVLYLSYDKVYCLTNVQLTLIVQFRYVIDWEPLKCYPATAQHAFIPFLLLFALSFFSKHTYCVVYRCLLINFVCCEYRINTLSCVSHCMWDMLCLVLSWLITYKVKKLLKTLAVLLNHRLKYSVTSFVLLEQIVQLTD